MSAAGDGPLRPFARLLADAVAQHAGRVAVLDPVLGAEVTYTGLGALVDEAAGRLLARAVPGERVAVLARNGLEQVVAALACSRAGLVHVGLPVGDPAERTATVLAAAGARLLLVQPGLDDVASAVLAAYPSGADPVVAGTGPALLGEPGAAAAASGGAPRTRPLPPLPEDAAVVHCLVATSGSTGAPRLVRLTGAMCDHAGRAYTSVLGLGPEDRTPVHLPMWWVSGHVTQLASTLVAGGSLVTVPMWSPAGLVRTVARYGATWLDLVPTLWHGLLREDGFSAAHLPSLRAAVFGGAPAAPEVLAEVRRRVPGLVLVDAYAMSEVPSPITCLRHPDDGRPVGRTSVGRAMPGVRVEVVDDAGRALPAGATGAVAVRTPALTPGYAGADALAVDAAGRFRTGDLGVLDADGVLTLTGRAADRIIRGGVTVHPAEVEGALIASGLVVAAVVQPVPSRLHGDDVAAVVVPAVARVDGVDGVGVDGVDGADVAEVDVAALRAAVRSRVGAHAVPVRVVQVEEIPRTPNGKPDRDAVRRLLARGPDAPASG